LIEKDDLDKPFTALVTHDGQLWLIKQLYAFYTFICQLTNLVIRSTVLFMKCVGRCDLNGFREQWLNWAEPAGTGISCVLGCLVNFRLMRKVAIMLQN
jgi:hypothetical protein